MLYRQIYPGHWLLMIIISATLSNFFIAADKPIFAPTIQLNDGHLIPALGLGTNQVKTAEGEQAVKDAIDIGYRHIDTAYLYGNEKEVGNAIRAKIAEGVIKREDIYVTTKLWNTFHEPAIVAKAFQKSLYNLNISYVDLYLIHFPVGYQRISKTTNLTAKEIDDVQIDDINPFPHDADGKSLATNVDYLDTYRAMEDLVKTGLVRSLGVSNFNSQQLDRLISAANIKPVVNQVECHPNLNQNKLIAFAKARNVTIVGYSPLGRPSAGSDPNIAIKNPKVQELADKYKKNPGQIILRFAYQNGVVAIPKSTNKERLRGNIDIFDFSLSNEDMEILNALNDNSRLFKVSNAKDHKYYPFNAEF
ncbi:1,5-anhydro-D-fructose reductase-like [Sitodiplosis mosellana]|uniref:1,5-anhydro-D-fructose reductase-like n=1 Tax=Sitodiplosis mosellana TaxID=263140 RepID=UPI002444DAF6|nr:1,5-anhydro-D-fructose reductase-like [Sitodiplosis mosellana]